MMTERLTQFSHGTFTFDVIDSGPIEGTPVVLLHGFPQRASSWNAVSAHLNEKGFRTFAPDQRGYSPGARPRSRFAYRGDKLAADIAALIRTIGDRPVHLAGHDWGAAVGWAVAGQYPELVSTYTAVSVGHPGAFMKSMLRSSQAFRSYYMALFQLPGLPERLLSKPGGFGERLLRGSGMSKDMYATFRRDIVDYGALRGGLGYYRSLPVTKPGQIGIKVGVPTTYVWSDGDFALSRKAADLTAGYMTGAYELIVLPGASHWLPDECPARIAEIIAARAGQPG